MHEAFIDTVDEALGAEVDFRSHTRQRITIGRTQTTLVDP